MNEELRAVLGGAAAGAVATLPMSAVMYAAERAGLMGRQPPEVIATAGLEAAGLEAAVGHPGNAVKATAVVFHFGFGAATGALFGLLYRHSDASGPPVARGLGYALLVYTVSYAGWIPALNILPPPQRDRPGRQPSMIAAHLVFGAALALLADVFVARDSP